MIEVPDVKPPSTNGQPSEADADSPRQGGQPVHLLVLTLYYAPDRTGIAPLTAELCEYLAARGHRVSVLTGFPHYPQWRVPEQYRGKLWTREALNGVSVYRGYIYVPSRRTAFRRIAYDTSVAVSAGLWALFVRDIDLVMAISTPLQLGVAGDFISRLRGVPFVFCIKDLVPDLGIALGLLRNPYAVRAARIMERYVYRRADAIVAICDGFVDNLKAKHVPESKIHLIPDWVDTQFISPQAGSGEFRKAHGIAEESFLVLHSGNMGAKQKLENLVEAAEILRDERQVLFLLVGDGSERDRLQRYAAEKRLPNVNFLPLQPRESMPEMLAAADALVVNQSAALVGMVIPSKLLTYMAAGRPVVAAVNPDSEAASCVRRSECGIVVPPEQPQALAAAIRNVYSDRAWCLRMGASGRDYAEKRFARDLILPRYEGLLSRIARLRQGQAVESGGEAER